VDTVLSEAKEAYGIFNLRQGISGWEREKFPVVQ
jgi:rhodanese-related sulfurtransferase